MTVQSSVDVPRPARTYWGGDLIEWQIIGDLVGFTQYEVDLMAGLDAGGVAVTIVNWKRAKVVAVRDFHDAHAKNVY